LIRLYNQNMNLDILMIWVIVGAIAGILVDAAWGGMKIGIVGAIVIGFSAPSSAAGFLRAWRADPLRMVGHHLESWHRRSDLPGRDWCAAQGMIAV